MSESVNMHLRGIQKLPKCLLCHQVHCVCANYHMSKLFHFYKTLVLKELNKFVSAREAFNVTSNSTQKEREVNIHFQSFPSIIDITCFPGVQTVGITVSKKIVNE